MFVNIHCALSILLNITCNIEYTHFNILLHIGEYRFQYYLILPEQLADVSLRESRRL